MLNQTYFNIIILGLILLLFYRLKPVEKMTDTDMRKIVKEVYDADVQAIKNLGDVANTLLSPDKKTLTLPFENVILNGNLQTKGTTNVNGNLNVNNNASFGINSGRRLDIISSKHSTEQTYLGFFDGTNRTSYLIPLTNGTVHVQGNLATSGQITGHNLRSNTGKINNSLIVHDNGTLSGVADINASGTISSNMSIANYVRSNGNMSIKDELYFHNAGDKRAYRFYREPDNLVLVSSNARGTENWDWNNLYKFKPDGLESWQSIYSHRDVEGNNVNARNVLQTRRHSNGNQWGTIKVHDHSHWLRVNGHTNG
jgi:hypothetical protein